MNMNLSELINEIVSDWAYRVNDGMPNPKNPTHLKELSIVLNEMGLGHVKSEILQSLNEAEEGGFTNPALNKKVRYKNAKGEDKEGIVGNLLRQPEDSPGRKAAEAALPPEGSPERDAMNQELGSEKDGKAKAPEDEKGKEGENGKEGGGAAEDEKKKKAAAMFDPKADPAMGARLDREKAASEKLAQKDKEDSEAEKEPTPGSPEDFKNKADKVAKQKEEAKKKGYNDSLHAMSDNQLDSAINDAQKKMHDAQKSGDDKAADKANTEYAQHKVEQEMRKASKGGDKEIADAAVGNFLARKKDYEEKYGEPYEADIPYPNSDGGERTSAKWGGDEPTAKGGPGSGRRPSASGEQPTGPAGGPNAEPPKDEPSKPDITPPADSDVPDANSPNDTEVPIDQKIEKNKVDTQNAQNRLKALERMKQDNPEQFATPEKKKEYQKNKEILASKKQELADLESQQKFDAEKKKKEVEPIANELKNRKTADGEDLDVDTTPNGSLIIGVEHGDELESTKQTIEQIQKLPKDTKVMFVGEGGMSKDKDGNIEFGGEQNEIRNGVKGHFDNAEESSWDENANIEDDTSQVYKEIEKELGSPSKSRAAIWTNMVGQGDNLKPEDYLDDEGKAWIIEQAKKGGSSQFDGEVDWNNLTDAQKKDLYELNYNDEGKMGDNEIMKGQQAYNGFRQKELDRKIKEAEDNGYTVIAPVGNSHVDMRRQRVKSQENPEQQPTDTKPEETPKQEPSAKPKTPPKATKDDIKNEKPGKEAKTDSGGSLYSIGGGYYSDKPNGPAKYVRTESIIEMAFEDSLNEDVFALFEKSITGTLQNGEKITVQELPPRAVKKATQRAKAAASSKEQPAQQPTSSTEKPTETQPKSGDFNPINADDVSKEMPKASTDTFGSKTDIPNDIDPKDLEKFNTDIDKVAKQISDAKEKGEKAPNINLCDVTVPGTNLYCDDNLGIPRAEMPQFKGKPQPGTPAADMPVDKNGEVDTEPLFKKMLEDKGIKVVQTEVPSDKLKATQSELVGDKVIGMMGALENDPNHPSITAPIYVSRDGYVIDGHHRWAAITAYNAKHPDNQIPMKVQAIDMDAKDAIPMCNEFAEQQGVAAKKADANNENPTTRDAVPTDEQANEQIAKEKEGLSHQENQAYEYLDGMSDEDKAEAIDKALNDRTIIQKAMQDTMVGNWLMKKGKMLKNVYKAVEQKYKTGRSGTTKDCSDAPKGPHANTNETIKEAPQNRQDYLASLDKTGKKKKKADDSKCKDVHVEDYQKRDENGKPKYKTVPVYESGEKPDPADFGPDGAYYGGLGTGYIGPRQAGTEYGNASKEDAFKASELDSKTGYFKRDGKYYGVDGEEVNEKGQKLDAQGNTKQKTERCWLCFPPGKKVPSTQEVADLEDDLTPEQKHVAHHAEHVEHERKHAVKHLAIEASLIIGGALAGPWLLAKAGLGGAAAGAGSHGVTQAAGTVAKEAAHHGAGEILAHIAKDFGKHALAETLGVSNPYAAAGSGLAASALSGGILESFWKEIEGYDLVLEGVGDKNDELASKDFFEKLCRLGLEKMKTYKMTPQQKLESIRSYKFEKAEKEKEKEKKDKLKDLASLLKEKTSNSKQNSINHFVEFASKRLNLKETPKVNLMSGDEFKNELAALGGYDPASKEIFVATDGRLTADILRTIAHEMVHRKQEEKGFLKNIDKDGSAGSKIENQANSIAGILMREYGKINKQIYNENTKEMAIKSLIKEIISEIELEEAEQFKARAKDSGKVVVFKSKDAMDTAVKDGSHEPIDSKQTKTDEPVKGASMFGADYQKDRGGDTVDLPHTKVDMPAGMNAKGGPGSGRKPDKPKRKKKNKELNQKINTKKVFNDGYFAQDGVADKDFKKNPKVKPTPKQLDIKKLIPFLVDKNGNTGFPKKYIKVLNRLLNTKTGNGLTISDFTDASGAGTLSSTMGELLTLMSATIKDEAKANEFFDMISAHVKANGKESIIDVGWVKSAQKVRQTLFKRFDRVYGKGNWQLEQMGWDTEKEVEAMGLENYKENKGFSTDVYAKVKVNGKSVLDEVSLKKELTANLLNGTSNRIQDIMVRGAASDEDLKIYEDLNTKIEALMGLMDKASKDEKKKLSEQRDAMIEKYNAKVPDEAKVAYAQQKQRELHQDFIKSGDKEVKEFLGKFCSKNTKYRTNAATIIKNQLNQKDDYINQVTKKIDGICKEVKSGKSYAEALIGLEKSDYQKLNLGIMSLISAENPKSKAAKSYKSIVENSHNHSKAVREFLLKDPSARKGLFASIREAFPLKALFEGEENMILGDVSADKQVLSDVFGVASFEELEQKLTIRDVPPPPSIVYRVVGKEDIPVAEISSRPDGIGYGGTWKLEMKVHPEFGKKLKESNTKLNS